MSNNVAKMLRQRSSNYHQRRIPTYLFILFSLLLLIFFFRPRLMSVAPWNVNTAPQSAWKENTLPSKLKEDGFGENTLPSKLKEDGFGEKKIPTKAVEDGFGEKKPPSKAKEDGFVDKKQPSKATPPRVEKKSINCSVSSVCSKSPGIKWDPGSSPSCPDYFGYIYEDLKPWRKSGITLKMVEQYENRTSFRLTIVDGRMYLKIYQKSFQTRDIFSIWGFIQLMEYYPGLLPDLDLMFDCVDWPIIKARGYSDAKPPPPLFRYCADDSTLDIPFPDWSYWGWSEINVRPWEGLLKDILKGTKKIKWENRDPMAYWKGNPFVADIRKDLLKCNVSEGHDWNARLYIQDWFKEGQEGYKQSKLSDQCNYRYKIYIEGSAWSVSLKNILACDSTTLVVKPQYYDFFSRRLIPMEHYWPVGLDRKCESVKFAVDWGNNHTSKAKAIGKAASNLLKNEVNISNVYDYMFHLLNEYAKLLRYKPSVPLGAKEICTQSMYCSRRDRVQRRFMLESMVRSAHESGPCNLPSSATFYQSLQDWNERKAKAFQQVEEMERKARDI